MHLYNLKAVIFLILMQISKKNAQIGAACVKNRLIWLKNISRVLATSYRNKKFFYRIQHYDRTEVYNRLEITM